MLKRSQRRWLSLHTCTARVVEQWPPLELFFASEVNEEHSPIAERVLSALKSPYVKATLEFMNFVLDELT